MSNTQFYSIQRYTAILQLDGKTIYSWKNVNDVSLTKDEADTLFPKVCEAFPKDKIRMQVQVITIDTVKQYNPK